jgi:hypothetical protein
VFQGVSKFAASAASPKNKRKVHTAPWYTLFKQEKMAQ